jgi:hypothetical protein
MAGRTWQSPENVFVKQGLDFGARPADDAGAGCDSAFQNSLSMSTESDAAGRKTNVGHVAGLIFRRKELSFTSKPLSGSGDRFRVLVIFYRADMIK